MLEFITTDYQPVFFILSFSICQFFNIKFPEMKIFLMRKSRRLRIHHAFGGGLLALISGLTGHPIWFSIGLGGMSQDVLIHFLKVLRKNLKTRIKFLKN